MTPDVRATTLSERRTVFSPGDLYRIWDRVLEETDGSMHPKIEDIYRISEDLMINPIARERKKEGLL